MSSMMCGMLLGAGVNAKKTYLDDVFSTFLYKGTNGANTVNTGLDMSGEGGLLWVKARSNRSHQLFDTARGVNKRINSDTDSAEDNDSNINQTFTSTGFTFNNTYTDLNDNNVNYTSWNFRKAKGFFDIVTWTGNATLRTISHSLGSVPGLIMIKRLDTSGEWIVYHRSIGATKYLRLEATDAAGTSDNYFNDTEPTASVFTIKQNSHVNANNGTYVAYLFADGSSKEATSRSVYFDGSSDYLLSTSSDYSPGTGDFTMEAWVNIESGVAATDGIYQLSSTSGAFTYGGIALLYKKSNSENRWELYGGNSTNQSESTTFTGYEYGKWVHTAIVKTSGNIKLYINGEERISATDTQNYSGYQYLGIGAAFASSYNFKGKVSNFKLTIGQALYTSAFTPTNVPLTTTSQSSTASNVKILCCNNSSVTGKTVGATITSNGTVTASTDNPNFIDTEASIFGESGSESVIKCGSYVGNGSSTGPEINLGWEPQWLLIKNSSSSGDDWMMIDTMRGFTSSGADDYFLRANDNVAEFDLGGDAFTLTSTGWKINNASDNYNKSGATYVYMAIRRPDGYVGKPPELGTDVFNIVTGTSDSSVPGFVTNNLVDFYLYKSSNYDWGVGARLLSKKYWKANTTAATTDDSNATFDYNNGFGDWTSDLSGYYTWAWTRHAGFTVCAYKGDGVAGRQLAHDMNKSPEMIWTKRRSPAAGWRVWHKGLNGGGSNAATYYLTLNETDAQTANGDIYGSSSGILPTSTHWTVGSNAAVNENGSEFISMLFSSVDGISKVGYYTGNNTTQTITTGFQPRFVIIKKVSSADNWLTFDTVRGWTSGATDKELRLNATNAQADFQVGYPTSTGFYLDTDDGGINQNDENYIYYAHA